MLPNTIDITHLLSLFSFDRDEPMLFTSGLFWILFLVFLPLYAVIKSRRKQMMLFVIAFSLYFFYKSSGWFFLLLVATSFIDWWVAQFIDSSKNRTERRIALTVSMVLSLRRQFPAFGPDSAGRRVVLHLPHHQLCGRRL